MTFKKCIKCNKVKPTSEFYRANKIKDGFGLYCESCNNILIFGEVIRKFYVEVNK